MNKQMSDTATKTSKPVKKSATKMPTEKILAGIDLTLEAFIGEASITIGELNALTPDSVIPLDAALNTAVELRINGSAIALGELVAVGDNFGVKITEISDE